MQTERALLVGIQESDISFEDLESSLKELEQLAYTSGVSVVGNLTQQVKRVSPRTLLGRGKVEEIASKAAEEEVDVVIFNDELSPAQQRNLESTIECKIIDRTTLILDIFAQHAHTKEGYLQVELAQLRYRLPRLAGKGVDLSRLGGGIGTRGPGETKLEVDRRRIRDKIAMIRRELENVRSVRALHRERRLGVPLIIVSLVGYTNAGKSTLMNALTKANVLVEDKLFATVDPTTRRLKLPNGHVVLLTDTVGFIKKLPTTLIEAFKATLEEIAQADLLLHLIDSSHSGAGEEAKTVLNILDEIGASEIPIIHVYNKTDLGFDRFEVAKSGRLHPSVLVSAKAGNNLGLLQEKIQEIIQLSFEQYELTLPQGTSTEQLLGAVRENGRIVEQQYDYESVRAIVEVTERFASWLKKNKKEFRLKINGR
ncbi:GTPase HflX [Bdellovibrionota bacterium]